MNKAIEYANEIKRKQKVVNTTDNPYLKRDYEKNIKRSIRQLRWYCKEKGLNFYYIMSH